MGLLSMATCQDHYSPAPAPAPTSNHKSRIYVLTPPAGLLPYHGLGGIKLQSAVTKVIALVCISYNSKNHPVIVFSMGRVKYSSLAPASTGDWANRQRIPLKRS